MESTLAVSEKNGILWLLKSLTNVIVAVILFGLYHVYDGVCYAVSNMYELASALIIMCIILFSASMVLVFLHQVIGEKFGWDVLGLEELNALKSAEIPNRKIFKRLTRWIMRRTWTIYWIGAIILGPPFVALLLRKDKSWYLTITKYVIPGTLISVFFWVFSWRGIGMFTWEQYVKPFLGLQ